MKKLIIIFSICLFSIASHGQKITQVILANAATIVDTDTTVWIPMKDLKGRHLELFWTEFDAADDTLDVGMSNNDSTYFSLGSVFTVNFPLVMTKAATYRTVSEGVTSYGVAIDADQWNAKYAVFRYRPVSSTSGRLLLQY